MASASRSDHDAGGICPETARLEAVLPRAKGLVFDCDGTLLDTMPIYYESWSRACDEVGLAFPIERFYSYAGRTVHGIFQTLIDEQLPADTAITASHCEDVKRRHHDALEAEGRCAGPIDVVVDIAVRYKGQIPLAVASSGWRDHVIKGLERVGILDLFDAVITACDDEVARPKPAPDIFLVAARRIGVDPSECIGFEDADLGMDAVRSAGFLYASDVRTLHMYPRNIEKRTLSAQQSLNSGVEGESDKGESRKSAVDRDGKAAKPRGQMPGIINTLSVIMLGFCISSVNALSMEKSTRRQWMAKGVGVVSGGVILDLSNPGEAIAEIKALPRELRQYTALAPLGSPRATRSKLKDLSLRDIAARLSNDLTNGATGAGGYFVSGDLNPELFRDDCVFVDPTNSVASLSRYRNALRILFDPSQSAVRLIEPLVVNEKDRTISGKVRSWGVLQLPWNPRISSYETKIIYSIDDDGLIYSQNQEWNIPASEALSETFTPAVLDPPFSLLERPEHEPPEVTELFEIINGHRVDTYPEDSRFRASELIGSIISKHYPWHREDLPGKWALSYLQKGPDGGGIDRRLPFPELWFNNNFQIFTRDSVLNVGELLGPALEVRVFGSLEEIDETSLSTPKRFRANIDSGKVCFGQSDGGCIPLPIAGEGLFDGVYLGERLRIGQNLNGGGARVVQIKIA
jgi:beta-phosphoglucomutase-like phosphatase (HAD superfamily)